ncbi:MAG: DUF4369 domain-containing protein [Capnocytophaga sp.]|nr:DUF4369 domain-containing protein [Capnocytophaga sp.]
MKKIILIFSTLLLIQCTEKKLEDKTMIVKGEVEGLKRGTIYLQKFDNQWNTQNIDSVIANGNGKFEFKVPLESPEIFALQLDKKETKEPEQIIFFGEPKEININTINEKFALNAQILGSETQKQLEEYNLGLRRFFIRNTEIVAKQFSASKDKNLEVVDSLSDLAKKNEYRKHLFSVNFALNYKNSYLSPYIALTEFDFINPKYIDSIYKSLSPEVSSSKYGKMLEERLKKTEKN